MTRADLEAFLRLIATPTLPDLGPEARAGVLAAPELEQKVKEFCAERKIERSRVGGLLAAALLWHDHLDESHRLSQSLHDQNGSFLHGIMHRREPDYSNAHYWFARVGAHPAFGQIAERIQALTGTGAAERKVLANVVQGGAWQPGAFIDACEDAPPGPVRELLQRIQAIEFEALVQCL